MNYRTAAFVLLTTLVMSSCNLFRPEFMEPIPGTLRVEVALAWNGTPHALGQVAPDHLGHPVRLDNLQLYVAPVELRDAEGQWQAIGDVFLVDFSEHSPTLILTVAPGTYDAVRLGLGLPGELNTAIDPASYPNSHPLSVLGSAGMFWTWASGYIFVKYEGKFALEAGQQLSEPLSYHCGTDASYRMVDFELGTPLTIATQAITEAKLTLDAANALVGTNDSINLAVDPVTHNANGDSLGGRMMDLLVDAWEFELVE